MPVIRNSATAVAKSRLFDRARTLYEANQRDWDLPLSKLAKMYVGGYLILRDFGSGDFPPVFESIDNTYQGELEYHASLPGTDEEESRRRDMRKPFGPHFNTKQYLDHLAMLLRFLDELGIESEASILEIGCGEGWMAEFLAVSGYDICATSLSARDVQEAGKRVKALAVKDAAAKLQFRVAAMESVHEQVTDQGLFDVVFVYEALHHAFSWKETFRAVHKCLRPGGWFLICNEPNRIHTLVSYRVARLSNTHEIGLSRSQMRKELGNIGFSKVRIMTNRIDCGIRSHWIAAQMAGDPTALRDG
jgi:2-polyprenyl-3-methyl-5-hydroxy-6-metoxy-1,4-benzoquinol methylase